MPIRDRRFGPRSMRLITSYRQSEETPPVAEAAPDVTAALRTMTAAGCHEYDTARSYGKEEILGTALAALPAEARDGIVISTKVHPRFGLDGSALREQVSQSQAALRRPAFRVGKTTRELAQKPRLNHGSYGEARI